MERLTLDLANELIAVAFREGAASGLRPLAAAVLDAGGHVIAFQRQEGMSTHRFQVAAGKAAGSLALGMSSRRIAERAADAPALIAALGPMLPYGPVPAAGALLIADKDGRAIGAIGVTGDTPDNDELCALAAVDALGLATH